LKTSKPDAKKSFGTSGVPAGHGPAGTARAFEEGVEAEVAPAQNDERFAMALARSRQAAGYGPVRIRAEMAQHSLAAEVITEAIAALPGNWLETAQGLVARRYLRKIQSDPAQSRKAVDFLLRRGFEQKTAYNAVKITEWPVEPDLIDESP